MFQRISKMVEPLWGIDKHERLKLFLLSLAYFLIIAAYTSAKELKDSVFMSVVGRSYIPQAKMLAMFVLIPGIFLYAKLVDRMRRYQLLVFFSVLYSVLGLVFAFYLGHPTIGLPNTNADQFRLFGWLFYFFMEGYTPFLVSVFWAFVNSVNSPESAKKGYGILVSGSKLGGMLAAALGWYVFSLSSESGATQGWLSVVGTHQLMVGVASVLLLLVPVVVYVLMKKVPGRYLHGYEAAYQHEKEKSKAGKAKTGVFAGIKMLIKYPYVLGIFGMIFFYEVLATVLSYLRLGVAENVSTNLSGVSSFLFKMIFMMHASGMVISLLGTGALLRFFGERICLMFIPLISGSILLYLIFVGATPSSLILSFIILKSINYAFAVPVRESLYIPTVKEIKFKSKSLLDAFGSKFSKSTGATFNWFAEGLGSSLFLPVHAVFFAVLTGAWFITALLLGRRYEQAIENNEVIGAEKTES